MLDLSQAMRQHIEWRYRLKDLVAGVSKETLDENQLVLDNLCILGQWIYGEGLTKYNEHESFRDLIQEHKKFHVILSNIVKRYYAGEELNIDAEVGIGSKFDMASLEIVKNVMLVRRIVEKRNHEEEQNKK